MGRRPVGRQSSVGLDRGFGPHSALAAAWLKEDMSWKGIEMGKIGVMSPDFWMV